MSSPLLAIRSSFVLLLIWGVYLLTAQSEASLSVEIRDGSTGDIVPAMVCITSLADHKWRTPPDGSIVPPYSRVRDFYDPAPWTPGQIGPVRLTTAEPRDGQGRVLMYDGQISYPYWHEPAAYFVPQPFSIRLPAGKWRLAVAHGPEFIPYTEEFEVAAGSNLARKVRLKRWVDMPRMGWYSGDDHVHYPRLKPEQSEFLLTWARAEDVHVANILRMGDFHQTYFEQAAYGKASHYQHGDYVLVTGQEDPRTNIAEQGHVIALNITAPIRDVSRYHQFDYMFDEAHKQGALTGYAHVAWASDYYTRNNAPTRFPTWDPNINVPRGKVDFLEILQFRHIGLEDFYDFLNLGYKLTATAGSDLPWGSSIGETRTYAYTGSHFSAEAWFDALKNGHTFVTNGPMLTLTAGKMIPGDEMKFFGSRRIRVHAQAWAPPEIGTPKLLEVIANGKVIRTGASELDFTLDVDKGQWIAARVTCENGAMAHTSPIYFNLSGQGFRDRDDLSSIAAKRLARLDFIEARLKTPALAKEYGPEEDALRKDIGEAREIYHKLATAGMRTDIEFGNVDGVSLKMDAWVPEGKGPFPTVVLVHGGGWNHGDKETTFNPIFEPLTKAGFAWFTVNYRLAPKYHYPAAVDDVVLAIKYIEAHAREFKVDANRIAISGESAGGHIVAMIGARYADELHIKAVVPFYPATDFDALVEGPNKMERAYGPVMNFAGVKEINDESRKLLNAASPVTYVHKGMPPYLIIAGTGDETVGFHQSQEFCDAMKQAGSSCEIYVLKGAPHWLMNWENHPEWQGYKQKVPEWLKEKLP